MLLTATLAGLGLISLNVGSTHQIKVHELRSDDIKTVCDLRTAVFSDYLTAPYSKIVQSRKWEQSIKDKTKVLVASATGDFATELMSEADPWKFAGDEAPIIGTVDMLLVPIPGLGSCCYVSNVCVDPCARRRGVARVLMEVIDEIAPRELGVSALTLHVDAANVPALRLYESVGFRDMDAEADAPLVELFSSNEFLVGDEGEQRLMIKPLQQPVAEAAIADGLGDEQSWGVISQDDIAARQDVILAMGLREQIEDLERLLATLKLTAGATPEELVELQKGLDTMRGEAQEQEAAKKAWLAVLADRCKTGDNKACEALSSEERARGQWLAKLNVNVPGSEVAAGANAADVALPTPATSLEATSLEAEARAAWMSKAAAAAAVSAATPVSAPVVQPPVMPSPAGAPASQASNSVVDAAAQAAASLSEEDCDVNPFL